MKSPYDGLPGEIADRVLAPGESMPAKFRKDDGALSKQDVAQIKISLSAAQPGFSPRRFYVLGLVNYLDDLSPPTLRQTAFCRVFNNDTGKVRGR